MTTGTKDRTTEYIVRPSSDGPSVEHGTMRATIEEITPELAELYLKILEYRGQRRMRQHHVDRLAKEMERGTFRAGTMIEIMQFDGREYLINGQHRLLAVVQSKTTQPFTVQTTKATSMEQVAFAYGRTDIGLKRTAGDLYSALDMAGRIDLPSNRAVQDLAAAIRFMLNDCLHTGGREIGISQETMIDYLTTYAPTMRDYSAMTDGCEARMRPGLFRAATVAIALLTMRFAAPYAKSRGKPAVEDFWRGVIFDDGLTATDPRKFANRHLRDSTMSSAAQSSANRVFVTAPRSSRYLAQCFNAYMDSRQVKMVKVMDDTTPLKIYGVPVAQDAWW